MAQFKSWKTDLENRPAIYSNPHYCEELDPYTDYLQMILTAKVYDVAIESPLQKGILLSKRLNNTILYKREDLQPVFSFKLRGAHNMIAHLTPEERKRGIICSSAGNHAQGVALAASTMDIEATIVMPIAAPPIKIAAVERMGGKVILHGDDFQEAKVECERLSKERNYTIIPPFDNPYIIAGQGTIGMEILRQYDFTKIDAIFVCVGGGGLIAGIASYIKRVYPKIKIIGVETYDADVLLRSILAGERVDLEKVGLFADGTAVRIMGKETFRIAKNLVDEMVLVNTDELCAAIKDVFEDTRSVLEPAGALSVAGAKKYLNQKGLTGGTYVTICSGANMNFDRLRFVADRADFGQQTEALICITISETPNSFLNLYETLAPCEVTGFSYRYGDDKDAQIFMSLKTTPNNTVEMIMKKLYDNKYLALDATHDEMAKTHVRYLIGGRKNVKNERIFRFSFPERTGALGVFLIAVKNPKWNISLFHYRNYGGDMGKVMIGMQVPPETAVEFAQFLGTFKYNFVEETGNPIYKQFLK